MQPLQVGIWGYISESGVAELLEVQSVEAFIILIRIARFFSTESVNMPFCHTLTDTIFYQCLIFSDLIKLPNICCGFNLHFSYMSKFVHLLNVYTLPFTCSVFITLVCFSVWLLIFILLMCRSSLCIKKIPWLCLLVYISMWFVESACLVTSAT